MSVPSQSICALETTGNRKFLFFVDKHNHIVYYEREPNVAANFNKPSHGVITEKGTEVKVASNFISGITYNGGTQVRSVPLHHAMSSFLLCLTLDRRQQVRIYYVAEDPDDEGSYVLRESCCTMGTSTAAVPSWFAGELNGNAISVKQHSLLTAMSQQDGFPMVLYENPAKHTMWSAFMTLDQSTNEENWTHKKLNLNPDPNSLQ
jgi:hypothetical protein